MFLLSGIMISNMNPKIQKHSTLQAATPMIVHASDLPLDLRLSLEKKDTVIVHDTVCVRDTVYKSSYRKANSGKKLKGTKAKAKTVMPDSIPAQAIRDTIVSKIDTLYVPSLYIIVPLEKMEEPNDTITDVHSNCV